jgi:hypothetical protein
MTLYNLSSFFQWRPSGTVAFHSVSRESMVRAEETLRGGKPTQCKGQMAKRPLNSEKASVMEGVESQHREKCCVMMRLTVFCPRWGQVAYQIQSADMEGV